MFMHGHRARALLPLYLGTPKGFVLSAEVSGLNQQKLFRVRRNQSGFSCLAQFHFILITDPQLNILPFYQVSRSEHNRMSQNKFWLV